MIPTRELDRYFAEIGIITPDSMIVSLSGGLDSTVLLAHCYEMTSGKVFAVSFDYGQRHRRELDAAVQITKFFNVTHTIIDLTSVGRAFQVAGTQSSLLFGEDVPHGHYAEDNMKSTIVPNRNMIFLSILGGIAVANGSKTIAIATHAGDHAVYPDCRPEFIHAAEQTLSLATGEPMSVYAPFILVEKRDIVRRGHDLKAPMHLTWSCYEGGEMHCGRCGTCVERIEAFLLAHVTDPTYYDPRGYVFAREVLAEKGTVAAPSR